MKNLRTAAAGIALLMALGYGGVRLVSQSQTPTVTIPVAVAPVAGQPTPPTPGVPAVEVHTTPSPAAPDHWPDQAIWALIMSYALQYVKNCKRFTFLTHETEKRVQAIWGFCLAFATAAGIHITTNGSFMSEGGVAIGITGLSFVAIKDVVFQWAAQQAAYDSVVSKRTPAPDPAHPVPPPVPVKVVG